MKISQILKFHSSTIYREVNRLKNSEYLDTVLFSRKNSKICFVTFAERKSIFYVTIKMKVKSSASMLEAIKKN